MYHSEYRQTVETTHGLTIGLPSLGRTDHRDSEETVRESAASRSSEVVLRSSGLLPSEPLTDPEESLSSSNPPNALSLPIAYGFGADHAGCDEAPVPDRKSFTAPSLLQG